MLTTRFTEMVGCSVPIQQAGMGRVSPPQLAAAVSQAGGLGTVAARQAGVVDPPTLCWPAGESVSGLKRVQCAGEIVRELAAEAEDLLRRW